MSATVRIKLVVGQWYAFSIGGPRRQRNLLLVPAINFCRRLDAKATGETK